MAHIASARDPRTGELPSWQDTRAAIKDDPRFSALEDRGDREKLYASCAEEFERRNPKRGADSFEAESARKKQREHATHAAFLNLLAERVKNPWHSELEQHAEALEGSPHWKALTS